MKQLFLNSAIFLFILSMITFVISYQTETDKEIESILSQSQNKQSPTASSLKNTISEKPLFYLSSDNSKDMATCNIEEMAIIENIAIGPKLP